MVIFTLEHSDRGHFDAVLPVIKYMISVVVYAWSVPPHALTSAEILFYHAFIIL